MMKVKRFRRSQYSLPIDLLSVSFASIFCCEFSANNNYEGKGEHGNDFRAFVQHSIVQWLFKGH